MNCSRAKELLALYAGGDLTDSQAGGARQHMHQCLDCRKFYEGLVENQSLLRSLRSETVAPATLTEMRHQLYSRLDDAEAKLGFWLRFERLLMAGFRRPRYAITAAAIAVVLSATLFAQLHRVAANPDGVAAVLESGDILRLPSDYRDWVLVSSATPQLPHVGERQSAEKRHRNVYMSPAAYQEYKRTGVFPEGTVMILEIAKTNGGGTPVSVAASVKDRRLGGWGYFQFMEEDGRSTSRAQALPESAGCLVCHRDRAATDNVFTQFYPVLRSASGVL